MQMKKKIPGVAFVLAAAFVFSFAGVFGKWMPWSPLTMVGARGLIAAVFLGLWRKSAKVKLTKGVALGAFGVCATSLLFLYSNKLTTAANAIVLQYAMPVVVMFLSAVIYRQKPTRRDLLTAACVIVGIILCFLDNLGGGLMLGNILAIISAFAYALVFFSSKLPGVQSSDYIYLGNLVSAIFALNIFRDPLVAENGAAPFFVIIAMGALLALGYALLSKGMENVDPVPAAIVSNVEPVLNPIWVFLAMGEKPGWTAIVGAVIVLGAVTIYSIGNTRQMRQ